MRQLRVSFWVSAILNDRPAIRSFISLLKVVEVLLPIQSDIHFTKDFKDRKEPAASN